MVARFEAAEARNKLEDLSGIQLEPGENPYNALIKACNNEPVSGFLFELAVPKLTMSG
jgi:hypothetical protein